MSGGDVDGSFEAALGASTVSTILLPEADLAPPFFDVRTGVAGEVLQKFVNFRMPSAIVVPSPARYGDRFMELVYEHQSHPVVRFFATEDEARAWPQAKVSQQQR